MRYGDMSEDEKIVGTVRRFSAWILMVILCTVDRQFVTQSTRVCGGGGEFHPTLISREGL